MKTLFRTALFAATAALLTAGSLHAAVTGSDPVPKGSNGLTTTLKAVTGSDPVPKGSNGLTTTMKAVTGSDPVPKGSNGIASSR